MARQDVDRRAGNLPTETTSFVGRDAELAQVCDALERHRLVTLTGVGGVGKSRLALRAAEMLRASFPDGAWLVELSPVQDPALLAMTIAAALRLPDQTTRSTAETIGEWLADRRLMLVLDTCEHLAEECGRLVDQLLAAAPEVRILLTTRQPVGSPDEYLIEVRPMSVPAAGQAPALHDRDALRLFEQRAAAALDGFSLRRGDQQAAVELCRRLEGIPLAIELAAAQVRLWEVWQLANLVEHRFEVLAVEGGTEQPRHRALRTTIGWSHELCAPLERLLWARLSVFSGDFDREAAQAVCSGGPLEAELIGGLLEDLVHKSVVGREVREGRVRYRMLDAVREYGAEWLHELDEVESLRIRHRDWYLRLAEQDEQRWFGPAQLEIYTRVEREYANVRAALAFCLDNPAERETGLHMAAALWFYWAGCGSLAEGRHWLDRALELSPHPGEARAEALWANGYIALKQGDSAAATAMLEDCREQPQPEPADGTGTAEDARRQERVMAYAVHRLGCAALVRDDHARAGVLFKDALARYEELGEMHTHLILAKVELAMTIAFQGDVPSAVDLCEDVRSTCEDHGERWVKAYALHVLAFASWTKGRLEEARELSREALQCSYAFNDLVCTVLSAELLALLMAASGSHEDAAMLQGAAQRIWRSVGLRLFGSVYFNAAHHECEARAREALGDRAYEAAFHKGAQMTLGETVAFARERPVAA